MSTRMIVGILASAMVGALLSACGIHAADGLRSVAIIAACSAATYAVVQVVGAML